MLSTAFSTSWVYEHRNYDPAYMFDSLVVCPSGEFASIRESMGRD